MKANKFIMSMALVLMTACGSGSSDEYPVETFKVHKGKTLSVTMVNHGSLAMNYRDFEIQIDPVSVYGDKVLDYSVFAPADLILITHEHGDHLNPETIEEIRTAETRILLNEASTRRFDGGEVVHNGDHIVINEHIAVDAVPAYNITPGHEKFHPVGNGNGYVLDFDGFKVYVAGDTEDIPELGSLGEIDLAFLPVNQPYTMTVDQCVAAALTIKPKVLVPYHLGETDMAQIKERLDEAKSKIDVRLFESLR